MSVRCLYCESLCESGALKCKNCSAPLLQQNAADFRSCPYCKRRLLALGSPSCNYCGKRLPEEYIASRKEDLRRLNEIQGKEQNKDLNEKIDELIRLSSIEDESDGHQLGHINWRKITDLLS